MNRSAYLPGRAHRLDPSTRHGVSCDEHGPKLGPVPLLRRTLFGFVPRPAAELDFVLSKAFGVPVRRAAQIMPALHAIADALDRGDLALAMITMLHLNLPAFDDAQAMRARKAEKLLKAGFNPAEPRDACGRWTCEGDANIIPAQDVIVEPWIGDLPSRPSPFPLDIAPPGINPPNSDRPAVRTSKGSCCILQRRAGSGRDSREVNQGIQGAVGTIRKQRRVFGTTRITVHHSGRTTITVHQAAVDGIVGFPMGASNLSKAGSYRWPN